MNRDKLAKQILLKIMEHPEYKCASVNYLCDTVVAMTNRLIEKLKETDTTKDVVMQQPIDQLKEIMKSEALKSEVITDEESRKRTAEKYRLALIKAQEEKRMNGGDLYLQCFGPGRDLKQLTKPVSSDTSLTNPTPPEET